MMVSRRQFVIGSAAAFVSVFLPSAANSQVITFVSVPQGTLAHFQTTVLSKMLLQKTDLKVRVTPLRGTEAVISATNIGRADLFLGDVTQISAAIEGLEPFEGKPKAKDLRAVARLMGFPISIMVKKDSRFQKIEDLRGQPIPSGWSAFKHGEVLMRAVLATGGLTYDDVRRVPTVGVIRAADDMKSGKVVGTIIVPTAPKVKEVNAALGGVRFLSLGDVAKAARAVKSIRRDFYVATLNPAPHLTGIEKPTAMVVFDMVLTAGAHVSDETAYEVAKAVYENKDSLAKGHSTFRLFQPKLAAKNYSVLKYHPGAIKFYKDTRVWANK